jgi:hypothetical protein
VIERLRRRALEEMAQAIACSCKTDAKMQGGAISHMCRRTHRLGSWAFGQTEFFDHRITHHELLGLARDRHRPRIAEVFAEPGDGESGRACVGIPAHHARSREANAPVTKGITAATSAPSARSRLYF